MSSTARRTASLTRTSSTPDLTDVAIRSFPGGVRAESTNGRSERSSATTSSQSAVSITFRVTDPATLMPYQWSAGSKATRPRWVFNPTSPHAAAGSRIEPPPSVAEPAAANPAATATADPPLDPPGESFVFHGFRVTPNV